MSPPVRFALEAAAELEEAARWYEARRGELGPAFLTAVDRAIEMIVRWPDSGPLVEDRRQTYRCAVSR